MTKAASSGMKRVAVRGKMEGSTSAIMEAQLLKSLAPTIESMMVFSWSCCGGFWTWVCGGGAGVNVRRESGDWLSMVALTAAEAVEVERVRKREKQRRRREAIV